MLRPGKLKAAAFKIPVPWDSGGREVGRLLHIRGVILEQEVSAKSASMQHGSGRQGARRRAAHIVWDQAGFWERDADAIRRKVSDSSGIPVESILLTATHTHSGIWHPVDPNPRLVEAVAEALSEAAGKASQRLEPVRAGWCAVHAPGIRRNRTVYLRDGRAYTERWAIPSTWHVPKTEMLRRGPADDQLRIMVLERLDGSRLAVAANISCHNSAALKDHRVTDDFYGAAAEIVEEAEDCTALITPGSEGDQDPTASVEMGGERDMEYARRLGGRLAGYILVGLADVPVNTGVRLSTASRSLSVPVREDWKRLARERNHPEITAWADRGEIPAEINVLAVGDYAVVGIPAEYFTTPARSIREKSPFPITSVVSLTNGMAMYIAEKDAFFRESQIYGVHPHHWTAADPGTAERLVEAALSALRSAQAGL